MHIVEYVEKIVERKNKAQSRAEGLVREILTDELEGKPLESQNLAMRLKRLANEIGDITSEDPNSDWR